MLNYSEPDAHNQVNSSETPRSQSIAGLKNARDISMRSIIAIAMSDAGLLVNDLLDKWLVDGKPANNSTVNTGLHGLYRDGVLDRVREGNAYRYSLSQHLTLNDVTHELRRRGLAVPLGAQTSLFDTPDSEGEDNVHAVGEPQTNTGDNVRQSLVVGKEADNIPPSTPEEEVDSEMGERTTKFFGSLTDALAEFNAMEREFDAMRGEIDFLKAQNAKLTQELELYRNQRLAHAAKSLLK